MLNLERPGLLLQRQNSRRATLPAFQPQAPAGGSHVFTDLTGTPCPRWFLSVSGQGGYHEEFKVLELYY